MGRFGVAGVGALCGAAAACPYLAPRSGAPGSLIFIYLSQLPLFISGLWGGVATAALAGCTASLTLLLAAGDILAVIVFVALNAVPVILLVRQALLARSGADGTLEWYPPGLLAAWLTGLGLTALAVSLLLFGGPDHMQAAVREVLAPAFDRLFDDNHPGREELAGFVAMVLPGVAVTSWMVMTLTNGSLAQGLLARFGASWRPSPALTALELPAWLLVLLFLASLAACLGGAARFIGINVMIVLGVPFCLAGLAVLHVIARKLSRPAVPLVAFYVLAALFGWPLLVAFLLGLLDTSLGLRQHIRGLRPHGGKNAG